MLKRMWTLSTLCLISSLTTSCAPPKPVTDACSWETKVVLSPGWETRWTGDEKRWALAHNNDVAQFCR